MDALEAYGSFLAVRNHFTQVGYDAFRYNFKVKTSAEKFNHRPDRFQFQKLSRHEDPIGLAVSNFVARDKVWVTDLFDSKGTETYVDWKRRKGTLRYAMKMELSAVEGKFDALLTPVEGQYPPALRLYLGGRLSPETMVAIHLTTGAFDVWDSRIDDDVFWPSASLKLRKYVPFVEIKKEDAKKILIDIFSER